MAMATAAGTSSSTGSGTGSPRRALVAFDFDHTIVDGNTDTHILRTLPEGLPADVADSYQPGRWTEYMGRVLQHLHSRGVTATDLRQELQQMPITAGMQELFAYLATQQPHALDIVIISDSNTLFIDWVLAAAQLPASIHTVFTNPAAVDEATGCLTVAPMHKHSCTDCPVNMCKTEALQGFIEQRAAQGFVYDTLAYVGDGGNDVCPVTRLQGLHYAFARSGFALERKLQGLQLGCRAHVWHSGAQIIGVLQGALSSRSTPPCP